MPEPLLDVTLRQSPFRADERGGRARVSRSFVRVRAARLVIGHVA